MRRPGPPLLVASLAGWAWLAALIIRPETLELLVEVCSGTPATLALLVPTEHPHRPGGAEWVAMLFAMAPLLLRNELVFLWKAMLARSRWRAIALFLAGYCLPWLVLGCVCFGWPALDTMIEGGWAWLACAAAVWHFSPPRQRLLNACHARPRLRAFDWPMLADAGLYGLRTGSICVGLCGPLMLVAMLQPGHHLVAMGMANLLLTIERHLPVRPAIWQIPLLRSRGVPHWHAVAVPPAPAG